MTNWNRKSVRIGSAAVALAFMLTGSVGAFTIHENRLTFNRPVALPGIVLPAGTYSFDVVTGTAECRGRAEHEARQGLLYGIRGVGRSTCGNAVEHIGSDG
jgi:hypothetical protein